METTINEPMHVHGEGGIVTLDGPDGLVATMSADVAQRSAEKLIEAAERARTIAERDNEETR